MALSGGHDIVIRLFLLKHEPHSLNIILCVAPVPFCVKIAKIYPFAYSQLYPCNAYCYLSCDEVFPSSGAFMVEQDAIACEHAVAFPVVLGYPVGIQLCNAIGASWI